MYPDMAELRTNRKGESTMKKRNVKYPKYDWRTKEGKVSLHNLKLELLIDTVKRQHTEILKELESLRLPEKKDKVPNVKAS